MNNWLVIPDISLLPIRPEHYRIKELMEKWTRVAPCVVEGEPDAHNSFFVAGNQQFCISSIADSSKEGASWLCWQFAKALEKVLDDQGDNA